MFEEALKKQEVGACQPRLECSWGLGLAVKEYDEARDETGV